MSQSTNLHTALTTSLEKILPAFEKLVIIDAKDPLPVAFHVRGF
jgi:hypothetical protein